MRKLVFIGIAVAAAATGINPAAAQRRGTIVHDGPRLLPHVRLNRPDGRVVIKRETPMRDRIGNFDMRDYRRDPIILDRGGHGYGDDRGYGSYGDDYGYRDDYAYEDDYAYRDDDAYREGYDRNVEYGDARDLDYDRNYPYDHPYGGADGAGGYGFGGYTMTETITTTTTPTVVKRSDYVDAPVAVHKRARYKTSSRVHRSARRSIKGPRR